MTTLLFDIETNGFLDVLDRLHCLVIKDADTGQVYSCAPEFTEDYIGFVEGLELLSKADKIVGHNIIKFDIPAIHKLYPWWEPQGQVIDTLVLTRMLWPELAKEDAARRKKNPNYLPGNLVGRHKLEAFGIRLNCLKGEYVGPNGGKDKWATWNPEMQHYCEQDVEVTDQLYKRALVRWQGTDENNDGVPFSDDSVQLEHDVAVIVARQEAHGFGFNTKAAASLYAKLSGIRTELEGNLKETFQPWYVRDGKDEVTVPKVNSKKYGRIKGIPFTKIKLTEFNPGSRHHIASRLKALRGWVPTEFTPDGRPKVDETVLTQLEFPEAKW